MLEEKLLPVRKQLKAAADFEGKYLIVKKLFQDNTQNMADGVKDLTHLCELPDEDRHILSYPIIGNWVLEQMNVFEPQSIHQQKVHDLMRTLVSETRLCNRYTRKIHHDPIAYTQIEDELIALMLRKPEESMPVHELMCSIASKVADVVSDGSLEHKDTFQTDLGHGLYAPLSHLSCFMASSFEILVKYNYAGPIGLTIMVVDDEIPDKWYNRLLSVGFEEIDGQQGYFYDCESALQAMQQERYDVILTDLELGEGKMDGITFVKKAYELQVQLGVKPRISVFSYNDKLLQKADDVLGYYGEKKIFNQVNFQNKRTFTAAYFKEDVMVTLDRK